MRFLWIILTSVQLFATAPAASSVPAAAAEVSSQAHQPSKQFPNYFRYIDYVVSDNPESPAHGRNLAEYSINKALTSILNRLEIPYIDKDGTKKTKEFFSKLLSIAQSQDPNVKLYVFGGVVRSLLGYIYKKLHNANLKAQAERGRPLTDDELKHLTRRTFTIITSGVSYEKYDAYLQDKNTNPALAFDKDLPNFSVLGVGSDLDIVYSSAIQIFDKKPLEDFIARARAEIKVEERSEEEDFINSFLPKADVLNYEEQLKRTMEEGGSSLDWLAFPIGGDALAIPSGHPNILKNIIQGTYQYLPPPSGTKAKAKQTVRGLRPLLELPFLKLDEASQTQLESELDGLTSVNQKDVDKLVRNARYGAANNRLTQGEGRLVELVKKSTSLKIPIFLKRTPIATRVVKNLSIDNLLMPRNEFEEKYTKKGVLLHGTGSLNNVLYMVRNGLFMSQDGQGLSAMGPGVYTTPDVSTAKQYAGDKGIILEFPLNPSPKLRIVDYANPGIQALLKPDESLEQFFFRLARDFDIDIIVNTHVLIQNAEAVKTPKKAVDFLRTVLIDMERQLQSPSLSVDQLQKIYDVLYTDTYRVLLALLAPGEVNKIEGLKTEFPKALNILLDKIDHDVEKEDMSLEDFEKINNTLYIKTYAPLLDIKYKPLLLFEKQKTERINAKFLNKINNLIKENNFIAAFFVLKNDFPKLQGEAINVFLENVIQKMNVGEYQEDCLYTLTVLVRRGIKESHKQAIEAAKIGQLSTNERMKFLNLQLLTTLIGQDVKESYQQAIEAAKKAMGVESFAGGVQEEALIIFEKLIDRGVTESYKDAVEAATIGMTDNATQPRSWHVFRTLVLQGVEESYEQASEAVKAVLNSEVDYSRDQTLALQISTALVNHGQKHMEAINAWKTTYTLRKSPSLIHECKPLFEALFGQTLKEDDVLKLFSNKPKITEQELLTEVITRARGANIKPNQIKWAHKLYINGIKLPINVYEKLCNTVIEDGLIDSLTALNKLLLTMIEKGEKIIGLDIQLQDFISTNKLRDIEAGHIDLIHEFYKEGKKLPPKVFEELCDKVIKDRFTASLTALNKLLLTMHEAGKDVTKIAIKTLETNSDFADLKASSIALFNALILKTDLYTRLENFISTIEPRDIEAQHIDLIHEFYKKGKKLPPKVFEELCDKVIQGSFIESLSALNKLLLTMLEANEDIAFPYAIRCLMYRSEPNAELSKSSQALFDAMKNKSKTFNAINHMIESRQEVHLDHILLLQARFMEGQALEDKNLTALKNQVIESKKLPRLIVLNNLLPDMNKSDERVDLAIRKAITETLQDEIQSGKFTITKEVLQRGYGQKEVQNALSNMTDDHATDGDAKAELSNLLQKYPQQQIKGS